jgi:hypothetical protein
MTAAPGRKMPSILRGVGLIARGRTEGLNCFRDSPQAFLHSLLPGLGVMAAAFVQAVAAGSGVSAVVDIPATLCILLAPAVISYELARRWGREAFWNRYIVAFNWCQLLLPCIAFVMVLGVIVAQSGGRAAAPLLKPLFVCLAFYALWLNWFLARHGLALTPWRAAAMVGAVNIATLLIMLGPNLLAAKFK